MTANRYLIVNSDDFGLSPGVNRGIIEAHEHGIVTSASLMLRWPASAEAAAYAREHPALSTGLHLDLGEWVYRSARWVPLYEVVPTDDAELVEQEVHRQLEAFRELTGCDPTHLDSHQHVHRSEPVHSIVAAAAKKLGVPLRGYTPTIRYRGDFYGQTGEGAPLPDNISVEALIGVLESLEPGFTELGCHAGYGEDLDTIYRKERQQEVATLTDPRVREAIGNLGIRLCSFREVVMGNGVIAAVKTHLPRTPRPRLPLL